MTNWRGQSGMAAALAAAPSVAMPDDHEYWNNYPHEKHGAREGAWTVEHYYVE